MSHCSNHSIEILRKIEQSTKQTKCQSNRNNPISLLSDYVTLKEPGLLLFFQQL